MTSHRVQALMPMHSKSLPYGIYFGASEIRKELPGFSVSLLEPTLRAEDVPLHTHENASFVLVLSGAYLSGADGAPAVCTTPTLIFNPAGTCHRDSFVLPRGRFLTVSVSDETRRLAAEGAALPSQATMIQSGSAIPAGFNLAQRCIGLEMEGVDAMEGLCWELLSNISGAKLWPEKELPSWLGRAREILHDHCSGPLQLTDMAKQLGVHPVYFARAFRRAFRCTPGEYRMRCRLQRAIALSRDGRLSLADIALKAGFFDQSHFSKAFRDHFGIAPHAYRKHPYGHLMQSEVQFVQE